MGDRCRRLVFRCDQAMGEDRAHLGSRVRLGRKNLGSLLEGDVISGPLGELGEGARFRLGLTRTRD